MERVSEWKAVTPEKLIQPSHSAAQDFNPLGKSTEKQQAQSLEKSLRGQGLTGDLHGLKMFPCGVKSGIVC